MLKVTPQFKKELIFNGSVAALKFIQFELAIINEQNNPSPGSR